jgi:tetratricopeptide (TPR) repeat protein
VVGGTPIMVSIVTFDTANDHCPTPNMQRLLRWTKGSSTTDADAVDEGSNNSNSEADDIYDTESDGDGASASVPERGDYDKPTATTAEAISSQYYEEGGDMPSDKEIGRNDKDRGYSDIDIAEPSTASQVFNDNAVEYHVSTGLILIDGKEVKPNTPTSIRTGTDTEEHDSKCDERVDDIFPQAEEFLIDLNDDTITLANQATEIVDGFNVDDNDNDNIHGENVDDDAKTIATHRTTGTRVHPISSAFRSSVTNKEEKGDEHNTTMQHPHQSIYDILDRNFEQLGDSGSSVKLGGRQIGHKDVKLCFVAFVAVFRLPSDPPFIQENLNSTAIIDDTPTDQSANNDTGGSDKDGNAKGEKQSSSDYNNTEASLLRVPLSVAFALWCEVLRRLGHTETTTNQSLSYIRSTLVLLGMLSIAKMDRDRDDGVASTFGSSLPGVNSNKSIDCLVVQDRIHQQYGEYLVWGNNSGPYRSQVEMNRRRWNEAVRIESEQIGSNYFTLRMLPLHTMRAHHFQETFDLLKDKTFVRRRIRVLGAMRAARAHVSDMDELLRLIESCISSGDTFLEPIDEREGLLGAYQQMLKFCLHETEELSKCNKGENGNTNLKLGKAAMLKSAQIGNAVHLLGTSLGGYGFFDEEMQYYRNALEVKTLAENGNIDKSVSASDTLHSMGFSLDNAGKRDEALVCYNQALSIRYACIGEDDLRVAETLHNKVML